MTQLYLIAAAIIVLLATRRIYQKNIELFLIILLICNFEFFGLIKVVRFSSNLRLLVMPIIISIFIELLMMKKKISIGKYGVWVILFFVIVVNGVLISALIGQPIIIGIKGVKFYFLMLIYFFIVNHKVDIDKFINYLLILALVIAGLSVLQFVFPSQIQIFGARSAIQGADKIGADRIGEGGLLISMAALFSFSNLLKKKGQYYLYVSLALLAHLVFIVQSRMLVAGVILTCILVYFVYNRFSFKAIFAVVFVGLVLSLVVFPFITYDELSIVKRTMKDFDNSRETLSSYDARLVAFEYYLDKLQESPIFGSGFKSIVWRGNDEFYLQRKGLHLSDVGIMDFIFKTGLVGLTWLLAGLTRFFISIVKGEELSTVGAYILFGMMTMVTIDVFVADNAIFMFGLFVGLLANESDQKETRFRARSA